MPLDDTLIQDAKKRYWRELDRYQKLADYVHSRCKGLVRDDAIRATTQARAKDPERFEEKLRRYQKDAVKVAALNTDEDVMTQIGDLAGVRVATYVEADRKRVVEAITKNFDGPPGKTAVEVEVKDGESKNKFYRATHCQVTLKESDLVGTYQNLKGLTCEIQVCSLLAHVFNEIEHDLSYKPLTGETSQTENGLLNILARLTETGDSVVTMVLEAVTARQQSDQDPFADQYDFVARTRDLFTDTPEFAQHAGQLFDELKELDLDNPSKLQKVLLQSDYQARSMRLVDDLNSYMQQTNDSAYVIDRDSSDRLLMLLLDNQAKKVIDNHQVGRGYGRAPRIYSVALRFQRMRDQQSPVEN